MWNTCVGITKKNVDSINKIDAFINRYVYIYICVFNILYYTYYIYIYMTPNGLTEWKQLQETWVFYHPIPRLSHECSLKQGS
jgi:hypothetical protein